MKLDISTFLQAIKTFLKGTQISMSKCTSHVVQDNFKSEHFLRHWPL
jgi:hypothetical protein